MSKSDGKEKEEIGNDVAFLAEAGKLQVGLNWANLYFFIHKFIFHLSYLSLKNKSSQIIQPRYVQVLSRVPLIAYIFVSIGCVASTIVAAVVKSLDDLAPLQIASHRNFLIFAMALPVAKFYNK